ncbi:hypothetical protein ACFL27_02920 [candidate division CSSED10-310 bacterium]|uniref:Uncharacterized protein n=1 Tax=candidate division CSSED10-310 bacterium TaxID=2855610 RepID=A0ABV6YSF9_UNCC1
MKGAIIFTGTGPILILTTYASMKDPQFIKKLAMKGIKKFIACELDLETVKKKYGDYYNSIMNDVKQTDDLRVLDYNGHSVFYNFSFHDIGKPIFYEP